MANYTIPEEVIGIPLFVPEANDYFSIEPAGMPNGDPCLVVHGDVSRDYKAYQVAPLNTTPGVVPGAFTSQQPSDVYDPGYWGSGLNVSQVNRPRSNDAFAISFWIKPAANTTTAGSYFDTRQILFGVMNDIALNPCTTAGYIAPNPGWYSATAQPYLHGLNWAVTMRGNNSIGYMKQTVWRNTSQAGGGSTYCYAAIPPNQWTFVVINAGAVPFSGDFEGDSSSIYLNDNFSASMTGKTSSSFNSCSRPLDCYFSIGSMSDGSNMNGREGEWRIGKLAFHDHHLNHSERLLMYYAMVGV